MEQTPLPDTIQQIEHNGMRWIDIQHPDKSSMGYLKQEFQFHALDYEDVLGTTHRSKIDKYEQYIFLVMLFPVYNRKTKQIESAEIDFFLGTDYLITIHRSDIPAYIDLVQLCQTTDQARESTMKDSPQYLLYKILQRLFQYCYPIMDHIDLEIDEMENNLFKHRGHKLLQDILFVRHNIIDIRKIIKPHQVALNHLKKPSAVLVGAERFELDDTYDDYFDDILDYTEEIWNQLESFKEAVDALQQTNESLISYRINEIMKTLTIFSVLLLPAGVIASIFGMNSRFVPFADHPQGFYSMIAVTLCASVITLLYIRRKKLI